MQINSVTTFSVVYVMIHARVWRKVGGEEKSC